MQPKEIRVASELEWIVFTYQNFVEYVFNWQEASSLNTVGQPKVVYARCISDRPALKLHNPSR
jgi:hypothetical protein